MAPATCCPAPAGGDHQPVCPNGQPFPARWGHDSYLGAGEPVSLVFPGQDMAPDYEGAPPGGSVTYSLVASTPGTFLYESGINPQKQVLMGLYGVLIVRPQAEDQAYDDADGHSA